MNPNGRTHLVQEEDVLSDVLQMIGKGMSLRAIANEYGKPITHADIARIARGRMPATRDKRAVLALPALVLIDAIGDVAEHSQATASRLCYCGQAYIPNHPKRRRCYSCSPVQKRER